MTENLNTTNLVAPSTFSGAKNCGKNYSNIADAIISDYKIVTFKKTFYLYENGVYREDLGTLDAVIYQYIVTSGWEGKESITLPISQIKAAISAKTLKIEFPFNKQKDLIPVRNGVIRIDHDGKIELLAHSSEYQFSYQLPIDYNSTADIRVVTEYLESTGVDKDVLLQIPATAILTFWGNNFKKAYLLKGKKNSGKTTFLNLLNFGFFGNENCSNVPLHVLINDCHSSFSIVGKIANIADELAKIKLEDVGLFKSMTGGGMIPINRKYCDLYFHKCDTTFIFAANDYPPVSQVNDEAFFERWCLVEFNKAHGINPTFEGKTFTEEFMSGFLNLVIDRMLQIMKDGINSESWEVTREMWLNDSDPFYQYIRTGLEKDNSSFVLTEDFYDHYQKHCEATNQFVFSQKEFGTELQNWGGVRRQRLTDNGERKRGYYGFRFKQEQLS